MGLLSRFREFRSLETSVRALWSALNSTSGRVSNVKDETDELRRRVRELEDQVGDITLVSVPNADGSTTVATSRADFDALVAKRLGIVYRVGGLEIATTAKEPSR